ncbi:TRAP transporter large permease [Aquibium sp. A9E412]|nr:TRAP transporter large permease [Aquibium sp. A9E412]MDN2566711.1 TRAP transporter large permease [Aquibium sp. A9E412]
MRAGALRARRRGDLGDAAQGRRAIIPFTLALSTVLLLVSVPIFLVFGIGSSLIATGQLGLPWATLLQTAFAGITKQILLAIPLFVFAGYVMVRGGIATRLINLCVALVGHWPGGLGIAMVLAMGFFAAFCGSVLAAITAIGTILMPRMVENGYPKPFVVVLAAMAALLEALIPPSNAAIIYSSLTQVPVARTFAAGIVPGIVLMLLLSLYVAFRCRAMPRTPRASWRERRIAFTAAIPALFTPVIVLGGIYGGFLTAAESAAVASAWALIVGFLVYRQLSVRGVAEALAATTIATSAIFIIIAMAKFLSVVLTFTQAPQHLIEYLTGFGTGPLTFLLLVAAACLLLGTFIEVVPIFYLVVPLTLAGLGVFGVDPIHFYIVLAAFIGLGMLTPPVCVGLYTGAAVIGLSPERAFAELPGFLLLGLVYGLIMILVPDLATWLPSHV